jgi:hypothetical protein
MGVNELIRKRAENIAWLKDMRVSQPQQKFKIFKGEVVQPATNH